jgi:hypothetical protein
MQGYTGEQMTDGGDLKRRNERVRKLVKHKPVEKPE